MINDGAVQTDAGKLGSSPFSHLTRNAISVRVRIRGLGLGLEFRVRGHDYTIGTLDALQACDACADMGMTYSVTVQCTDCVVFPPNFSTRPEIYPVHPYTPGN